MAKKRVANDFAEHLREEFDISMENSNQVVKSTIAFFIESIQAQEPFQIRGFANLKFRVRKEHKSQNPLTGEPITVPEKIVPKFKFSNSTVKIKN